MTMRVLVTGATGFIGRHALAGLAALSDIELHAASISGVRTDIAAVWHVADLRDGGGARRLIDHIRPTHLLHCAWIATPGVYLASPENIAWLSSSIELFEAFGAAGGQRLVAVGSSAEYLPDGDLCREDATPLIPGSVYGKAKLACSAALAASAEARGYSMAWGRLFLPYGPGDSPKRLIPALREAMRTGQQFQMSDGMQLRDFIWAPDAADLLVTLLRSGEQGVFNVGTGVGTRVRDVALQIAADFAAEKCLAVGVLPRRPGEPPSLVADMSKVKSRLGWRPSVLIADGLRRS